MIARVYIDGFSLYYRALKGTPYKWLNPPAMAQLLLPRDEIDRIIYCTAMVIPPPWDPDQAVRQQTLLRAFATIERMDVVFGHFTSHVVKRPLADGSGDAEVIQASEKGSDANLATHLLVDAHLGAFDVAAVLSNDTDLVAPIRAVRRIFSKPVDLLCPCARPSQALKDAAAFIKHVRPSVLAACQLPATMADANGTFYKPLSW